MRKSIFFYLAIAIFPALNLSVKGVAQSSSVLSYKIIYEFKHQRDSLNSNSVYIEKMVLYIDSKMSLFKSNELDNYEYEHEKQIEDAVKDFKSGNSTIINQTSQKRVIKTEILKNRNQLQLLIKEALIGMNYLIKDSLSSIKWIITSETKKIENLICQKATARFRGRNYVAWFCPAIPINDGPWKFFGLPGLILQVNDTKGQVVFNFVSLEKGDFSSKIKLPQKVISITKPEWQKMYNAYLDNPLEFTQSAIAANSGVRVNISYPNSNIPNSSQKKQKMNNPLELSDN